MKNLLFTSDGIARIQGGKMVKFVHIVSICKNKDNILESLKESVFPVQKVYLVQFDNSDIELEVKDMEKILRSVFEVDIIDVCHLEIGDMVNELLRVINYELGCGNMVFLNSTDSPEILNFVFYVCAHIAGCKLYTGIPTKEREGIEVLDISVEPCRSIDHDKLTIIKILHQEGDELDSLDKLIHLFEVERNKGPDKIKA